MQRTEEKSADRLVVRKVSKEIARFYVQPFIERLENVKWDKVQLTQLTISLLLFINRLNEITSDSNSCALLIKYTEERFKEKFAGDAVLEENFNQLKLLYLDRNKQNQVGPGFASVTIQTGVRELFHDYLNPLPAMKIQDFNTVAISSKKQIDNNGIFFSQPVEVQQHIYSYLQEVSIFSFKRTCKSAYFLQKARQDKQANIFYMLAGDVKITRPRTRLIDTSLSIALRENIPEDEIIDSLQCIDNSSVNIFSSLYQALEYAHHLQHGGFLYENEEAGFIPSLWMVVYMGHPAQLTFRQEVVIPRCDNNNLQRSTVVSYAVVPKQVVQPLLGGVFFSDDEFAQYRTFNLVDYKKQMRRETHFMQMRCALM